MGAFILRYRDIYLGIQVVPGDLKPGVGNRPIIAYVHLSQADRNA